MHFLNNANRLKGFTQGTINETIHLSKSGVRGMWDDFYRNVRLLLDSGQLTDEQFLKVLKHYAGYTDEFIEGCLGNITQNSTKTILLNKL